MLEGEADVFNLFLEKFLLFLFDVELLLSVVCVTKIV